MYTKIQKIIKYKKKKTVMDKKVQKNHKIKRKKNGHGKWLCHLMSPIARTK